MFTSQLLNKLNTEENFDWKNVPEDTQDTQLSMECKFLQDIMSGEIDAVLRSRNQLMITYPDNNTMLILHRPTSNDFMVYVGNQSSYSAKAENCRCMHAIVASGEVVAVLPKHLMEALLR